MATYKELITQAIDNFDNIYKELENKKVNKTSDDGDQVPLTPEDRDNGSVPVSKYATLINKQLFKIQGINGAEGEVTPTGEIPNQAGKEISATATITGSKVVISGLTATDAYINNSTTASGTLTTETKQVSGAKEDGELIITPSAGKILSQVSIDKGTATVNMTESNISATVTSKGSAATTENKLAKVTLEPSTGPAVLNPEFYQMTIVASSKHNANIKATSGATLDNIGYVSRLTNISNQAIKNIDETSGTSTEYNLKIQKGLISGISASGTTQLDSGALAVKASKDSEYSYAITASGTVSIDSEKVSISEGYIKSGDLSIGVDAGEVAPKTVYLKKGNLGVDNSTVISTNIIASQITGEKGAYVIPVSIDNNYSKDITYGYIPNEEKTFNLNISGSKNIPVDTGSVELTKTPLALTGSGADIFVDSDSEQPSNFYELTVNGSSTISTRTVTPGYIKDSSDVTGTGKISGSIKKYVAKGSLTPTATLSATEIDVAKAGEKPGNIFTDLKPSSGDYYEISSTPNANVVSGYIKSSEVAAGAAVKKYLPKAILEWVPDSNENNILQVKSGGYLPSGLIELGSITGKLDYADVKAAINGDIILKGASAAEGDYELSLTKNTSLTNAGYISGTNGTLSTDSTYYVAHGSAVLSGASGIITINNTPVWNSRDNVYEFTAASTNTSKLTLTKEGYIKETDIAGGAVLDGVITATTSGSGKLSLSKASLSVAEGSTVNIGLGEGSTVQTPLEQSATKYYVVPTITNSNINATTTAGYLSSSDNISLTISNDATDKIYIKSGTALKSVSGTDTVTKGLLTENKDNSASVTVSPYQISVSGVLEEGYYGSTEKNVSGTVSIKEKKVDISAAKASITSGASSAEITGTGVVLYDNNSEVGSQFVSVSTNVTIGDLSVSVGTKGYLKNASQITKPSINAPTATKYLKVLSENSAVIGRSGEKEKDIIAAGTYNKDNIKITLSADATGSDVDADLTKLEQRLAGSYTRQAEAVAKLNARRTTLFKK